MKIRNAEQYRKWQEDKQRRRKPKTKAARKAMQRTGMGHSNDYASYLLNEFGVRVETYKGDRVSRDVNYALKPNHAARTVDIKGIFEKTTALCDRAADHEPHYAHGRCPGYMWVRNG